jgi:hypothetical protein
MTSAFDLYGFIKKYFRFSVDFPNDITVQLKTVVLAACFLLDYLYFEMEEGD